MLGILQVFLLSNIVARWAGRISGQWTLAIALFHPILIWPTAFVMTETLFITVLFGGIACMQRALESTDSRQMRYLTGGAVLLGYGCLIRPALQVLLPVVAIVFFWQRLRETGWFSALHG